MITMVAQALAQLRLAGHDQVVTSIILMFALPHVEMAIVCQLNHAMTAILTMEMDAQLPALLKLVTHVLEVVHQALTHDFQSEVIVSNYLLRPVMTATLTMVMAVRLTEVKLRLDGIVLQLTMCSPFVPPSVVMD